jgi:hypothetical protein
MRKLTKNLFKGLLTLAVVGLTMTPRAASADITFVVDETVLPDTAVFCASEDCIFDADKINGFYDEVLTINPDFTFDVSARAFLSAYVLAGGTTGTGSVGCTDTDSLFTEQCYDMYALLEAEGSVDPLTGIITFTSADVIVRIDPDDSNTYTPPATGAGTWTVVDTTGDDLEIISSASLIVGTGELTPPVGGFFDIVLGDLDFTAFADLYWPGLDRIGLTAVTDGDFDTVPSPPVPGTYSVEGDLSVVFDVPEPAGMLLLGIGLLGSAMALRRRGKGSPLS